MKVALLIALTIFITLAGCSNKNIYSVNREALQSFEPGSTTIHDFQLAMPKAVLAGQNAVGGLRIDAYAVEHRHYRMQDERYVNEELWFYFHDELLVKWGRPQDWPTEADITVEWRDR